jgi:hypothetical protein
MGLTLHFELRLPGDVSREDVLSRLTRLRDAAAAQQFDEVSPIVEARDADSESDEELASAREWIQYVADFISVPIPDDERPRYVGEPNSAIGFRVDPGDGAETATFGLMRLRAEVGGHEEWYWWCSCKTQYASLVSDEHFVKVHTGLVAVLDAAVELGFGVDVSDEGEFWESRSEEVLVAVLTKMNRLMAKFGGALSDALGTEHAVQAEIFKHRRFERLEMGE